MKVSRLFVALMALYSLSVRSQHVLTSVQQAWSYAEKNNISIAVAATQHKVAVDGVGQAYGNLLPSVNLNGSFTDNVKIQPTLVPAELFGGEPGVYKEEQFGKRYIYNVGVSAQLSLINPVHWSAIKVAKANASLQDINLTKTKNDIYSHVAEAYYTCLWLSESESLSKESVENSRAIWQYTSNRYNEGQVSESVLNNAVINLRRAELAAINVHQNQSNALNNLKLLLGIGQDETLLVTADSSVVTTSDKADNFLLSGTLADDVQLAASEMLVASLNVRQAKAAYAPVLQAVYSGGMQVASDEFVNFGAANNLPQQYWGLRLSIPILVNNTRSFQLNKARADFNLKQKQYESIQRSQGVEDQSLLTSLTDAKEEVKRAREILELQRKNNLHATRQMEEGILSPDQRIKVYEEFVNDKNNYLHYLSDYYNYYYQLQVREKGNSK